MRRAAVGWMGLSLLRTLATAGSVTSVGLGEHTPLTEEVLRAVKGVSPKLSALHITHGIGLQNYLPALPQRPPPTPLQSEAATETARLLLRLLAAGPVPGTGVAAGLRELHLQPCDHYFPSAAIDALSYCTALTKLQLKCELRARPQQEGLAAESALLRTLSSLTSLRDLSVSGGARPPSDAAVRQARAASLESCLSHLTALTSLDMRLHCLQHFSRRDIRESGEVAIPDQVRALRSQGQSVDAAQLLAAAEAEWRALAAAARRIPRLSVLRTPALANAADLSSLTALTYLRVGTITLPAAAPPEAAGPAGAQKPKHVYDLPPLLQRLVVYAPLSVHVAAALRPAPASAAAAPHSAAVAAPPPPVGIHAGGVHNGVRDMEPVQLSLTLSCVDLEPPGRLTAEASVALRKALGSLTGGAFELSPYPNQVPDLGLRVMVDGAPAPALPPTAAVATSAGAAAITHCGSWLGEAKALRLGALALSGFALSPRDVLGLTRCMAGLKDLDLRGCIYVVDALLLLSGLPRLEQLRLAVNDWQWPLSVPDSEAIEAAFLSLTAAPPAGGEGGNGGSSAAAGPLAWRRRPPLPLLKSLSVDVDEEQDCGEEWGWLEEALAPARGELARRQPMPAELRVSYRDGDGGGAV